MHPEQTAFTEPCNSTPKEDVFSCVVAGMNIARCQQIQHVSTLKQCLLERGFSLPIIDLALHQIATSLSAQSSIN